MKAYVSKLSLPSKLLLVFGVLIGIFFAFGHIKADVPNEYVANYEIKSDRDKILGILVELDADSKIGTQVPVTKFSDLNASFQIVFPKFPQDYAFQVVYQQCLTLSQQLTTYTSLNYENELGTFMTNCYKPFKDILTKINSQYTIVATAKATPESGPAPLVVTLDARGSTDPSNDTIPSKNFYRYYRDTNGQDQTIGVGPVIVATFTDAGTYLVHLTVRSSNKATQGIFDGEKTISIDVTPKTANIVAYANGQKLVDGQNTKISIQEAEKGVVLDGSATVPMGGRQILSNNRTVTSSEGFSFSKDNDGKPGIVRVVMPGQGQYKIQLTTTDNEGNKISGVYYLIVSDPVAIIKQTPDKGTTSTTFAFDSSPSYSIVSSLKLYTRDVFDQSGNKIDTFQGQSIKENFKQPGAYTVKLTVEDQLGQTNTDSVQVFVESSDPIPQFLITPSNDWKYPSEFILDASLSSDVDVTNGFDNLSYEWSFSEDAKTNIVNTQNNNQLIKVQFDTVGTHTIKLVAKDDYGKQAEISKDITITSTLRPEIFAVPLATPWGNPVNFVVKSNLPLINYQWDFGDGTTSTIQSDKVTHTYKASGVYKVVLKVSGSDGMTNEVTKNVFIGDKDYPVGAFTVLDKSSNILTQNEFCLDASGSTIPAYQIQRYQDFTMDPGASVNTNGQKANLQFYFQPKDNEIYKQMTFKYKFNELGCTYVDFTTEDTVASKDDRERIRFKVINALPTLDNLILEFPQYGNQMGIGFNENSVKDIFNDTYDPLIVKVSALNPKDSDGFISYYKWYYTYKDDPTRYLETKITPGSIPYAFFSLARIPGEFMFGVTIYDNDGGQQSNQDIIGNGPIVFFPPDVNRPDIPLVTLKSDQSTVSIGDTVTFDVISSIVSDRPDFVQERTIQYDFDGDGTRDLTTKSDRVTYVYTTPNQFGYKPRAQVMYRGYKGVGEGGTIVVKNALKPMLLSDAYDTFAIFRDVSIGDIANKTLCLSLKDCKTDSGYVLTTGVAFSFNYPTYDKYYVSLDVTDNFANMASKNRVLSLTTGDDTGAFHILSIPKSSGSGQGTEFFVGKNLDNSILFYIKYDFSRGTCYVDADLNVDSNGDGISDNDKDFSCNQLFLQKYDPKYESTKGRIYYTNTGNQLVSQDFAVNFLDFQASLDSGTLALYQQVDGLISSLPSNATGAYINFKSLLVTLRDGLIDSTATKSNIVAVKNYVTTTPDLQLTQAQQSTLDDLYTRLADKSVVAAEGGNVYQGAKAEILSILPANLAVDVDAAFNDFETAVSQSSTNSQQDKRKAALQSVVDLITKNIATAGQPVGDNQVDPLDMTNIIMPDICKIVSFYNLVSTLCPNNNVKIVTTTVTVANPSKISRWRIILRVVGIAAGIFVALVIVFAIRARMKKSAGEEDEEEDLVTPPPETEIPQTPTTTT